MLKFYWKPACTVAMQQVAILFLQINDMIWFIHQLNCFVSTTNMNYHKLKKSKCNRKKIMQKRYEIIYIPIDVSVIRFPYVYDLIVQDTGFVTVFKRFWFYTFHMHISIYNEHVNVYTVLVDWILFN